MNYEQASDEDINHYVLRAIYGNVVDYWALSDCGEYIYDCGPTGDSLHEIELKDYCNNPADAWPVIVESKIDIIQNNTRGYRTAFAECGSAAFKFAHNGNLLRAAMIVFLMMNEDKQ